MGVLFIYIRWGTRGGFKVWEGVCCANVSFREWRVHVWIETIARRCVRAELRVSVSGEVGLSCMCISRGSCVHVWQSGEKGGGDCFRGVSRLRNRVVYQKRIFEAPDVSHWPQSGWPGLVRYWNFMTGVAATETDILTRTSLMVRSGRIVATTFTVVVFTSLVPGIERCFC